MFLSVLLDEFGGPFIHALLLGLSLFPLLSFLLFLPSLLDFASSHHLNGWIAAVDHLFVNSAVLVFDEYCVSFKHGVLVPMFVVPENRLAKVWTILMLRRLLFVEDAVFVALVSFEPGILRRIFFPVVQFAFPIRR